MSTQTPIDLWRAKQAALADEVPIHLLVEIDPEMTRWRRRFMFLSSIILHLFLVFIIVFGPDIVRRGRMMMGIPLVERPKQEVTTLFLPPDLLKQLREPPPEARALSDKNRRAEGKSPVIDPNGVHMPYSIGNTPLPEIAKGGPPPPAVAPTPPPGGPPSPQPGGQPPSPEPKTEAKLHFEDVAPENAGGGGKFQMPSLTPGQAIQQSMQSAQRGGYHGSGGVGLGGDSDLNFNNLHPNFSTEAPIILSDTRGVDFGPYLARIVYVVKRNWIAVIPESARLGEKGRTAIVFEILKDGSVPQLRIVGSSGSDPLDRAAYTGIHSSAPFPPLPAEFTGDHLVLEFIFLYNIVPQ
jgi:TonB family protein